MKPFEGFETSSTHPAWLAAASFRENNFHSNLGMWVNHLEQNMGHFSFHNYLDGPAPHWAACPCLNIFGSDNIDKYFEYL